MISLFISIAAIQPSLIGSTPRALTTLHKDEGITLGIDYSLYIHQCSNIVITHFAFAKKVILGLVLQIQVISTFQETLSDKLFDAIPDFLFQTYNQKMPS